MLAFQMLEDIQTRLRGREGEKDLVVMPITDT